MNCTFSEAIWNDLHKSWNKILDCPLNPLPKQIILGDNTWSSLLNHIVILYKKLIYKCKLKKEYPSFQLLKIDIRYIQKLEFMISERNGTMPKYFAKWQDFAV